MTEKIWDSAETIHGQSVSWLKSLAHQCGVSIGMSFLEVEGTDFFNSFVLATPTGEIAGRVRKAPGSRVTTRRDIRAVSLGGSEGLYSS